MTSTHNNSESPDHYLNFQSTLFAGGPDHDLHPGWFIGSGIVLLILGAGAFAYPIGLTLASSIVLGLIMSAGGFVELLQGFVYSGFSKGAHLRSIRWESIIMGVCLLVSGLLIMAQPVAGAVLVTAFLGTLFIFAGIGRLFWVIRHHNVLGRWGIALSAAVTFILGVVIFATLPSTSLVLIGTLIAIELFILGVAALFFGLSLRKWQHENAA